VGGEGEQDSGPLMGSSMSGGPSHAGGSGWRGGSSAEGESAESEIGWSAAVDQVWGDSTILGSPQAADNQKTLGKRQETTLESSLLSEINGTIDINLSLSSNSNGLFGRILGNS
jgi:hypothetical protein